MSNENMKSKAVCEERQTLDSSLNLLKNRVQELKSLARFAERTVSKMNRQEPAIDAPTPEAKEKQIYRPFPEEFFEVGMDINRAINRLGEALENLNHLIE